MRLKRLTLTILAATALTACGDKKSSTGTTLKQLPPVLKKTSNQWTACIDLNRNWSCDDGDQSQWFESVGETELALEGFYTLIEKRDSNNQRLQLLISSDSIVTAGSTQKAMLNLFDETISLELADEDELNQRFTSAIVSGYLPVSALSIVSSTMNQQANTPAPHNRIDDHEILAHWYSSDPSDTRRQLSAQGNLVLNNTDSNRLYLFDGSENKVNHREIDLIPLDESLLTKTSLWQRKTLAWVRRGLDITIDTVSAATAINGEVSSGNPVVLAPGQGINAAQLINGGNEALILMSMLDESHTENSCTKNQSVSEGIFRVALSDSGSYQHLEPLSTCIHSGFNLLTSNNDGNRYAAWDAKAEQLWLFSDDTMSSQVKLDVDHPVQSITMTPGGKYMAAVAKGKAFIIDTVAGKVLHTLSGTWGNVVGSSFTNAGRSLLIASNNNIHTLHLNSALQLISQRQTVFSYSSEESIRSLNVMADGDSYFVVSDSSIRWMKSDGNTLATQSIPHGMNVQQSVATQNQLLVLARGTQDLKFALLRYPLSLPKLDQADQADQ